MLSKELNSIKERLQRFNSFSANSTKWSNTLTQIVDKSRQIV